MKELIFCLSKFRLFLYLIPGCRSGEAIVRSVALARLAEGILCGDTDRISGKSHSGSQVKVKVKVSASKLNFQILL
jgi:hypothetical protein